MKDNIVARVVTVFVIMLTVLVIVAVVAVRNVKRATDTSDWVNHTHELIMQADAILASLHAGDSALRSYFITGDPRDQAAYRQAYNDVVERLALGKALAKSEAPELRKFQDIEALISKRIDFARTLSRTRQADGFDALKKALLADSGSDTMFEIQSALSKFKEDEKSLLRERDKANYLQAQTTRWTVLTGVGLNFLLLGFTAWLVRDDIAARKKAAKALEDANAVLEEKVKERTAELAAANETLRAENLERLWGNKSLEHQLRYSNLIINSINELVFVLTKTLNITRVNPAVAHLTGLETAELITSPLSRVVRPAQENPGRPEPFVQALRDGRDLTDFPVLLVTKEGQGIPHRLNLVPLRDRDKVVGGVVTLRSSVDGGN